MNLPKPFPSIKDFKPFLGYGPEDYENAKDFYTELGFQLIADHGTACTFDTMIGHRFLVALHQGYDRSHAGMMHFWVESVDEWNVYLKAKDLPSKFSNVKLADPTVTDWGLRVLYVWDPGGWLLHFAEPISE